MIIIQQNQPVHFGLNNFRRLHRNRSKEGTPYEVFLIELEVTEEDWISLGGFPQDAIGDAALVWTDRSGVDRQFEKKATRKQAVLKAKKEPEPKGEYGEFWRVMTAKGFMDSPTGRCFIDFLRTAQPVTMNGATMTTNELIYVWFGVDSKTFISPEEFAENLDSWNQSWRDTPAHAIFAQAAKAQAEHK